MNSTSNIFVGRNLTNITSTEIENDQTGLFIGLFLLFLLLILISYLFYSFISFKRFHDEQLQINVPDTINESKIEKENSLFNGENDSMLIRENSFSDCGTSIRSSSINSHRNLYCKRSSSYKLCSQTSNQLLTPRLSSQNNQQFDELRNSAVIIDPIDGQSANAISRSISKYCQLQRKDRISKRRIHSCEDLTLNNPIVNGKRRLKPTSSLPMRSNLRTIDRIHRTDQKNQSLKPKPTTIYELYKSDRMRISNLLLADH